MKTWLYVLVTLAASLSYSEEPKRHTWKKEPIPGGNCDMEKEAPECSKLEGMTEKLECLAPRRGSFSMECRDRFDWVAKTLEAKKLEVKALIPDLKNSDPIKRAKAAEQIGKRGEYGTEAIPALTECLKDPEWKVRYHAVRALGVQGKSAKSSWPELQRLAREDPNSQVSSEASTILFWADPEFKKVEQERLKKSPMMQTLNKLDDSIEKMTPEEWADLQIAVAKDQKTAMSAEVPESRPPLDRAGKRARLDKALEALKTKKPESVMWIYMLGSLGEFSSEVVPVLEEILRGPEEELNVSMAIQALSEIGDTNARKALIRYRAKQKEGKK